MYFHCQNANSHTLLGVSLNQCGNVLSTKHMLHTNQLDHGHCCHASCDVAGAAGFGLMCVLLLVKFFNCLCPSSFRMLWNIFKTHLDHFGLGLSMLFLSLV